jgi:tetratricopeptide (TPR) repeat protein
MARQSRRLAALCAWAVSIAAAQDSFNEARRLNNDAAALYAAGNFEAALHLYQAAFDLSRSDSLTSADIASNLGALYQRLNRYAEAEHMYKQALDLRRSQLPPVRPEIADSMNNLAEVYRREGRYWEARNLAEAAVRALEQADSRSPDMPIFLNNWAGLEKNLQHPVRAEQLLRQAWSLAEKSGASPNRSLAVVMNTLAQLRADQLDYENAEPLYRRAEAIFESAGPDCRYELAVSLANLGRTQARLGHREEGRRSELRALTLVNAEPHPDNLLRAAILRNMGNIAAAEGNVPEALAYFEESLNTQEKILGPQHPSIADVLFDYAAVAARAGEKSQARNMRKRAGQLVARRQRDDLSRQTVDASAFVHSRQTRP